MDKSRTFVKLAARARSVTPGRSKLVAGPLIGLGEALEMDSLAARTNCLEWLLGLETAAQRLGAADGLK